MLRSKKLSFYFFALIFLISFSRQSYISLFFVKFERSEDQDCSPQQIRLSLGDLYYNPNIPNLRLPSEKLNFNQAYLVWLTKTKVCSPSQFILKLNRNPVTLLFQSRMKATTACKRLQSQSHFMRIIIIISKMN